LGRARLVAELAVDRRHLVFSHKSAYYKVGISVSCFVSSFFCYTIQVTLLYNLKHMSVSVNDLAHDAQVNDVSFLDACFAPIQLLPSACPDFGPNRRSRPHLTYLHLPIPSNHIKGKGWCIAVSVGKKRGRSKEVSDPSDSNQAKRLAIQRPSDLVMCLLLCSTDINHVVRDL